MTAEEIVKAYKADPSRENMLQLAHDNECTLHEMGEFLKQAATPEKPAEKKKAGRPPKNKKMTGTEATKKDKEKKVMLKMEPAPEEMREGELKEKETKNIIPPVIQSILFTRLECIREKRRILIESLDAINDEEDEIMKFLRG